ncbi:MAG: hypothetical protein IJW13_03405, partial [Clostridia bacterium]|nr:hypothetical protein [Clostridia bacterium]
NLAQYMNVRVEEFMQQTTLKEFVGYVEHFNEDSQDFSIWWYENKIKPELEKFKDMPFAEYDEQFHNGFYSRALPEELRFLLDLSVNGVLTEIEKYRTQENKWNIAGVFDDYVEGPIVDYLNQLFTQNSINSLDEKYFGSSIKNSVEQPFSGLLTFKGSDFKDLINLNASEAMLAQLDKITLADLLK